MCGMGGSATTQYVFHSTHVFTMLTTISHATRGDIFALPGSIAPYIRDALDRCMACGLSIRGANSIPSRQQTQASRIAVNEFNVRLRPQYCVRANMSASIVNNVVCSVWHVNARIFSLLFNSNDGGKN